VRIVTSATPDFGDIAAAVGKGDVARHIPRSASEEALRSEVRFALESRGRIAPPVAA
jgi:hypothetical protein